MPFRLELAPIGRPSPAQPPKGTRPVRVGDAEFDRAFIVQANDPEMARDFLTAPVRWAVANLLRARAAGRDAGLDQPRADAGPGRPEPRGVSVESLAVGVREALTIHDGLQSGVAARLGEGVAIVAAGPASAEDAGPPMCKVCGDPISAGLAQGLLHDLPDAPPPRLLGLHRRLLGLRLQGEDRLARLIGPRRR